jgi:hypothetical protein
MFGYPNVPEGCCLNDFNWGFVWRRLGKKRPLPNFSTNLLIQSKRPDVLSRARGALHTYGLSAPVWRYAITPHQHVVLQQIARRLGHRALVVYASTAFDTLDDLYAYTDNKTVVENCNFTRVCRLTGHEKWNYDAAGTLGVATSEPELIEDLPFPSLLESLHEAHDAQADAGEQLAHLANALALACRDAAGESPLARRAIVVLDRVNSHADEFQAQPGPALDFTRCLALLRTVGIRWLTGGDESEQIDAPDRYSAGAP